MARPAGLAQGDRRAAHHGPRTTARAPRRATGRADHGHRITYNRLRRRQQLTDPELTAHGSRVSEIDTAGNVARLTAREARASLGGER